MMGDLDPYFWCMCILFICLIGWDLGRHKKRLTAFETELTSLRFEFNTMVNAGKAYQHASVSGWEVWRWPETKAFLERAGFPWDSPTTGVTIHIDCDNIPKFKHYFNGVDMNLPKPGFEPPSEYEKINI